jgi:hypothetical protein
MTSLAFAFSFALVACDGRESPAPEPEPEPLASDLICLEASECGGDPDPEASCETTRARRFNADGSLTQEGIRLTETCSAEFQAQSACLLEHGVCEGGGATFGSAACAGPCKAECDAMTFCG